MEWRVIVQHMSSLLGLWRLFIHRTSTVIKSLSSDLCTDTLSS